MVVDDEVDGAVGFLEAFGVEVRLGLGGRDSLSESSSQPIFSVGERAAPIGRLLDAMSARY